jgi:pimeloyl-ACP methyl ester carboxylesterase
MEGVRHVVRGGDDVEIGLLTAGSGAPLLLVHGGAGQIEGWQPVWDQLAARWRVTAMDRRGRGSSGDGQEYSIDDEFSDSAAVAAALSEEAGQPIDVFAHSYGATCTIGAGSRAAPFRRMVLYEPPARETVSPEFVDQLSELVAEVRAGRVMVSFLMDIIGLSCEEVEDLKNAPAAYDVLAVLSATLPREGQALLGVDLTTLASEVTCPALFPLGERSPRWAHQITRDAAEALSRSLITTLPELGHQAIDGAPDLVVLEVERFPGRPEPV